MAKIELKGIVKEVGDIEFVGANNMPKQRIIILKPAFRNEYGEVVGKDETWPIDVIGENVEKFAIDENYVDKKVDATIYVKGNSFPNSEGEIIYVINANLGAIKIFGQQAERPTTNN